MKKLLFALLVLSVSAALYAEEPPPYLKDGKIMVILKGGKVYEYSTNEWMVVRRGAKKILPAEIAATKPSVQHFDEPEHNKNRVRLMGGIGPTGLKESHNASSVHIESKFGAVGGVGYDRSLSNKFSLGVNGYTNGTFSLGLGYDF